MIPNKTALPSTLHRDSYRFAALINELFNALRKTLGPLWKLFSEILGALFGRRAGTMKATPWMVIRKTNFTSANRNLEASPADMRRLLEQMKDLDDLNALTNKAISFSATGADFYARPNDIADMMEDMLLQNPPFLHIGRSMPSDGEGQSASRRTEFVRREQDVVVTEPCTLYIPQAGVEYRENKRPPGYPIFRAAKSLSDIRSASLLYQTLPEDLLISRLVEGTIPILAYHEERKYMLFNAEDRLLQHKQRRVTHVPIEVEMGEEGEATRLIYILFDRSTSMVHNCSPRGINAVMETAIAVTMIRSDMGKEKAKYYFRAFSDGMDPKAQDPPFSATTIEEKERLVQRVFETNFNGDATRVVDALKVAVDDIERIIESGELGENVKPGIGLFTDGRCTVFGNITSRIKRLGIEVDTVLIGEEADRNPDLIALSSSVSLVNPNLFRKSTLIQ